MVSNWYALVKKLGQERYVEMVLLMADAPMNIFMITI